jgi:hypothetical protein
MACSPYKKRSRYNRAVWDKYLSMLFRQFHQFLEFKVRIRGVEIKHKYRNFCGAKRVNWNSTCPFEIAPLSTVASFSLSVSLSLTPSHSSGLFVVNNDTWFPNQSSTTSLYNMHVHSNKLKHMHVPHLRNQYAIPNLCLVSCLRVPPSWNPNKYGPSHSKNSFSEDMNLESGFFDKCALNELILH